MEFLPLLVIGAVMYAVLILPQQRRNREHKALLASLEEGDEVLLNSGIHGFISSLDGNVIWLEVAEKVELKVSRSAVAGKVEAPEDSPTDDTEDS
jgi:preprotein translocase subunit YajC